MAEHLARKKFVGHCPHGQKGEKEDEYIGEIINVASLTRSQRRTRPSNWMRLLQEMPFFVLFNFISLEQRSTTCLLGRSAFALKRGNLVYRWRRRKYRIFQFESEPNEQFILRMVFQHTSTAIPTAPLVAAQGK
jgi:hypothetical protein